MLASTNSLRMHRLGYGQDQLEELLWLTQIRSLLGILCGGCFFKVRSIWEVGSLRLARRMGSLLGDMEKERN